MSDAPERTTVMGAGVALPPAPAAAGGQGRLVGAHLNEMFEVIRFLAQGGMGEVYEGRNIQSDERVAIKVILPRFAADEQFFALFKREAGALARLGHDALVKYRTLGFDRALAAHYLVTEFVPGPNLEDVLDGTPADPARARAFLERMAGGLAAAHAVGVLHRDLSPDNILLPDGALDRAKIIDFGLAKDTSPEAKSVIGDSFAGKLGYAAPEVFGKYGRALGPWTDVYGLALVVVALARGRPLEMGASIVDALELRERVPGLADVDASLRPVLAAMLEPDPARRLPDMPAVLAALAGGAIARATDPREAPAPVTPAFTRALDEPPPPAARKPASRMPLIAGGAGLLAVVGIAYAVFGDGPKPLVPAPPVAVSVPGTRTAAPGSPTVPVPAPVTTPRPDWATAAPLVARALAAVPCSDLRVARRPAPGEATFALSGWRPRGTALPAEIGGYRPDAADGVEVDSPSPETCAILDRLRAAATPGDDTIAIAPERRISLARQHLVAASTGKVFNLVLGLRPGRGRTYVSIDDGPEKESDRIGYYPVQVGTNIDATAPKRYLNGLLIANKAPRPTGLTGSAPAQTEKALLDLCRAQHCTLTTWWIDVAP